MGPLGIDPQRSSGKGVQAARGVTAVADTEGESGQWETPRAGRSGSRQYQASFARFVRRAASFGLVGGFVAVTGLALQYALVEYAGLDKHVAYFIQSIVSIELNFFINNSVTWGDRRAPGILGLAKTWMKFHFVRVFTVTLNQILYAALLFLGVQYLVANVLCILIILVINYWSGDKFIFSDVRVATPTLAPAPQLETALMPRVEGRWLPRKPVLTEWPSVSVVIPVKQSERTIEATVASLLQQKYSGPVEILLVGDKGDSTWAPLRRFIDAGVLTVIETTVFNAREDLNAKRNIGLRQARGQVLALVEPDMILPDDWMARGVEYIQRGWPCVVGSVKNLSNDLISTFMQARTYYGAGVSVEERVADVERFGTPEYRLPVVSNVFISREVLYYTQFPDPDFDEGYQDYQWLWELSRANVAVLSVPSISVTRRRRLTWRQTLAGYIESGRGCASFIRKYPDAVFSRRRVRQLTLVGLLAAILAAAVLAGIFFPDWPATLGASVPAPLAFSLPFRSGRLLIAILAVSSIITLLSMGVVSAVRIGRLRGIFFPFITVVAGATFSVGLARGLLSGPRARAHGQDWRVGFTVLDVTRQAVTTPTGADAKGAWSEAGPQMTGRLPAIVRESLAQAWPSVSVVIPVKRSQATIASAIRSLLNQDYRGQIEILLVGDVNDPTWEPIRSHIVSGRVTIIEAQVQTANRDANAKRTIGLHAAKGEILALTDSDMVLPRNWVSTGINYILKGWPCVAGPMRGARGDFWDSYADLVDMGSKTPRFGSNIIVDRDRFGQPYHKPPITANVFLTREVLAKAGDFDPSFTHSYEDYSWFWEVASAGLPIFCTPELMADHYHRQGWRQLVRQYTRAGRGCGDFVLKYPDSPLSQGRLVQLAGVWSMLALTVGAIIVGLSATVSAVIWPGAPRDTAMPALAVMSAAQISPGLLLVAGVLGMWIAGLLGLGVRNALAVGRPIALVYPFITMVFALAFSVGLTDILLQATGRWVHANRAAMATASAFSGTLLLGFGLRMWDVTTKPGMEWDEPVYANIAWNFATKGLLVLKPEVGHGAGLYFAQPPFYFALLAFWYRITGATALDIVPQARVLSVLVSVIMLTLLFLYLQRRYGAWALVPTVLIAVDSWIVFSNRISWIDNVAIPIGIAGLWAYDRALGLRGRRPFIVAGLILVTAALFKYLAIYFCAAVIINWIITRARTRDTFALLLTITLVLVAYGAVGIGAFTLRSNYSFLYQHLHQLMRTTDVVSSRGNVNNINQVVAALLSQYQVFVVTVGLCGVSAAMIVVDVVRSVFQRNLRLLRRHSLELSWALSAFVVFGIVQIKFINYFAYVMIPLLVYLSLRVIDVVKPWVAAEASHRTLARVGLMALLAAVIGLNLSSFTQRIVNRDDNTFLDVRAFASAYIPEHDQVLTEQPIGTMIRQPYCQVTNIASCPNPRWIILFESLTEQPPDDPQLQTLLSHSKLRATYHGFKETVYVYEIHWLLWTPTTSAPPTVVGLPLVKEDWGRRMDRQPAHA